MSEFVLSAPVAATRKTLESFFLRLNARYFAALWSLVFVLLYNTAFFSEVHHLVNSFSGGGALFTLSLALLLWLVTFLFLNLMVWPYIAKPLFIFLVIGAAVASYFMNA